MFPFALFFSDKGGSEKGRKLPENTEIVPNFSAARSPAHMRKRPAPTSDMIDPTSTVNPSIFPFRKYHTV